MLYTREPMDVVRAELMLRVALFAALTIVAFGDHGMTTTAAAEPDTTTTVAATTTTTAPIAGERRAGRRARHDVQCALGLPV